ncbi:hypothetical protein B0H34DRAFT_684272 [Crassisporium funariophilum]|nr:hypothetical protein B0H34DRAFT_684272 [Crassisporium funariophilum]
MHTPAPEPQATPRLGGRLAVAIFVFSLIAFVTESQLTQYVQTNLGYRQPFFLFYCVHSSFTIIFPLHLLYLLATTHHTAVSLFKGLTIALTNQLDPSQQSTHFPKRKFLRLTLALTVGITCPALLWFAAISLASVSDVTAIWNTNAFFAYLISVKLFKLRWEPRRLLAVSLATLGVTIVVYGGSTSSAHDEKDVVSTTATFSFKPSAPLVGNLLTLVASFGYGLYQVLYKIYAALPSDPEVSSERLYQQIPEEEEGIVGTLTGSRGAIPEDAVYPPPFGFHPNLLTSMMGFFTLVLLWIPIPMLHYSGAETFRLPPNGTTVMAITGIAFSGVIFNAGFMVLLGVWGPIIVSVGNLLTIVLMVISDIIFGAGLEALTIWSLLGSGIIVLAFTVLAYDMFTKRSS